MNTSPSSNSLKAYTRATHTVAKTRQVVMLYDGAIRCLKQAGEAIEKNHIEERFNKLTRASDIISGMQNCLDFESGGSTAQVLYDFYASIDMRIMQQHRTPSVAGCQQIIRELKEMRDVWDSIDKARDGGSSAASPSMPTPTTPTDASGVKVSA